MDLLTNNLLIPAWNAPQNIKALITTRKTPLISPIKNDLQELGTIQPKRDILAIDQNHYEEFNLATHVGDELEQVLHNRKLLNQLLPSQPFWLKQTHSDKVIEITENIDREELLLQSYDGSCTNKNNIVCGILTADCIPILISDLKGNFVAAIHAGWRGVYNQIISKFMSRLPFPKDHIIAYIGPAISKEHFIVGHDVMELFKEIDNSYTSYFTPHSKFANKLHCDLVGIAIRQMQDSGASAKNIINSSICTYANPELFYSFRRENTTGRIASLIWIDV